MVIQMGPKPERLTWTAEELVDVLGISRPRVFQYLNEGKIPARRLGRRWIIGKQVILDFLANPTNVKQDN